MNSLGFLARKQLFCLFVSLAKGKKNKDRNLVRDSQVLKLEGVS